MSTSNTQRSFGFAALSAVALSIVCAAAGGMLSAVESREATTIPTATSYQERSITLEQAVAMVEAKYKARALRYNTVDEEGHSVHYIRLITADRSRVFTVRVDAATGQELPQ